MMWLGKPLAFHMDLQTGRWADAHNARENQHKKQTSLMARYKTGGFRTCRKGATQSRLIEVKNFYAIPWNREATVTSSFCEI